MVGVQIDVSLQNIPVVIGIAGGGTSAAAAAEMGGGGGGHGSTSYKGYTIPHPKRWHVVTGKGLCAVMWFWVLYRAKQDGPVVLGWRHPWEGHEDHSHGHGHGHEHEASH